MSTTAKSRRFTEGPLFFKIFLFVIPIILSGVLQICYNLADHIVIGQFSGDEYALGAVGCTTSLTSLMTNMLIGLSAGAGVVIAQRYGAKDDKRLSYTLHTSITLSVIAGLLFMLIGLLACSPALKLMGTQDVFFDKALLYIRIICIGIPATSIYNFGASALRAVGDSKTPLTILTITGAMNVLFNLFFVIVCGMSVDGVAYATIIAQYSSAVAVIAVLMHKKNEVYGLNIKKLGIHTQSLLQILRYGIPSGIQSSLFAISNVIITSAINTFPPEVINAKTIASNIDAILYASINSYLHASTTFCAQNYGAKKLDRVKKSVIYCLVQVTAIGLIIGAILLTFARSAAGIFINDADPTKDIVIEQVLNIMAVLTPLYFLAGVQEALSGALRGLGHSVLPTIMSIVGICGLRMFWVLVLINYPPFDTIQGVFLCYPASWAITAIAVGTALIIIYKKSKKALAASGELVS